MSMEYCHDCDRMIDLDYDEHYFHFSEKYKEAMKGGKNEWTRTRKSNRETM